MSDAGWKIVPIKPTKAMMDAVDLAQDRFDDASEGCWLGAASVYEAMLAAAPGECTFTDDQIEAACSAYWNQPDNLGVWEEPGCCDGDDRARERARMRRVLEAVVKAA